MIRWRNIEGTPRAWLLAIWRLFVHEYCMVSGGHCYVAYQDWCGRCKTPGLAMHVAPGVPVLVDAFRLHRIYDRVTLPDYGFGA